MYKLFDPTFMSCATCDRHPPNGWSSHPTYTFKKKSNELYQCQRCNREFTLYEAVDIKLQQGTFGLLRAFSHFDWSTSCPLTPGHNLNVAIPQKADHIPFVAFASPVHASVHSNVVIIDPLSLFITTSIAVAPEISFPGEPEMNVFVYYRRNDNGEPWVPLLYESLEDFAKHRYVLSIFKLATCMEVFTDTIARRYLSSKAIAETVINRFMREGRNWQAQFDRIGDIAESLLPADELALYAAAKAPFEEAVRKPRNAFAHGRAPKIDHQGNIDAFIASLAVLWTLARLDAVL